MSYRPRIVDEELQWRLESKGAILIQGPKWCGKTTTAQKQSKSTLLMQDPTRIKQNITLAELSPSVLLEGKTPRLIDEWQLAPTLWDAVRHEVDKRGKLGQFILTGSSVPLSPLTHSHSGTGRIARLTMRPMTLTESGDAPGGYSLATLFSGGTPEATSNPLTVEQIFFALCRGGWPGALGLSPRAALQQAFDYVDAIAEFDISRADGVERDPGRARSLLRSYARMIGSQAKNTQILADITGNEEDTFSMETLVQYLQALQRIFVIEELPAWNPQLRSKAAIRTASTRHFVDPSLATAALRVGPGDLLEDLETAGFLFESMCVRDLRVYAQALDGNVYHYRDSNNYEADAVIHLHNGKWGLVEVKLSDTQADAAAERLLKLAQNIDQNKLGAPSFVMVITAGPYAYQRPDGVHVVPLPCLSL